MLSVPSTGEVYGTKTEPGTDGKPSGGSGGVADPPPPKDSKEKGDLKKEEEGKKSDDEKSDEKSLHMDAHLSDSGNLSNQNKVKPTIRTMGSMWHRSTSTWSTSL